MDVHVTKTEAPERAEYLTERFKRMHTNYRKTLIACYLAFIVQAITSNFVPLLFLKFHNDYSIPLGKIALIPMAFFLTQLMIDVFCAKFVDAIGYRRCIVASEVACVLGLAGLAVLPDLFPDPFAGIMVCVVIYAVGSGLIEVLASPIVEACPFDNKDAVMSLLHGRRDPFVNAFLRAVRNAALADPRLHLGAHSALQYLQFRDLPHRASH